MWDVFLSSGQNSRFEVFFVVRTVQSFCRIFLENLRLFLGLLKKKKNFLKKQKLRPFFFFLMFGSKKFPQKKVETFFFLGFDPKFFSIKMIYIHKQKLKDVLGYFWNLEKRSLWGIVEEVEAVVLGYFWRNRRSRFGVLFTEN